jgi:PAS domain S-box-containing protein
VIEKPTYEELAQRVKELEQREEKYRHLFETAMVGIYRTRIEDGKILAANEALAKMMGYEGVDTFVEEFVTSKHYANSKRRQELLKQLQSHGKADGFEVEMKRCDGSCIHIALSATIYPGRGYIDGTIIDITERKQAEVERENLRAQLNQAQKMEALGILAGGIAHDFNNLLMGIQGRTSLMMLEADRSHSSFKNLQEIENCIQKSAKLTEQLLSFARGGKYEIKPTDLNELVENSVQMFGRTKKNITIFNTYEENLLPAAVDRSQIEQVLLNIFINAWQAMPEGGNLYVQTKNEILYNNFVQAYGVAPGKYIRISIRDTGIGMDKKTMDRVFDPFFTTKEKERGTGFGLASAYGIIQNHDGIITVESAKDKGTTFHLYLPASDKPVIEDQLDEQIISAGSETLLVIDDEAMIIDISVQMLEEMGYKVLPAHNGKEAIEIFKHNNDKVAMVILDLIMPGMGGGEVYERLKEIDPTVKVLLSSGYSIKEQAAEILNRGCDGFIQKPFKLNELSYKLREIISK